MSASPRSSPRVIRELAERWSLTMGAPFDHEDVTSSWVAPAIRSNGEHVVLKLGMPHMEAEQEIDGLRFWAGDPTVRLLEADDALNAMVLEQCRPGTSLRSQSIPQQDRIIGGLLRRVWRAPAVPHRFRHLSVMTSHWSNETRRDAARWPDAALVQEGIAAFAELSQPRADDVLLATDLHAGNVLQAEREPWLVIDPKPFIGDPAYDATQHLFNTFHRLQSDPQATIADFARTLDIDAERVCLWMFARAAAEPREVWSDDRIGLARKLSPH
jgi:streptomycin 6-kinase